MRTALLRWLALALSALALLSVAPAADAARKPPTKADLAALRGEVERAAASLQAGTAALERVQADAARLSVKARAAERRSAALTAEVTARRDEVGAVASAAYRSPMAGGSPSWTASSGRGMSDQLQAMSYLSVVSARRAELLRAANAARVAAQAAQAEARSLASKASAARADAARRVSSLRAQSAALSARLTAVMAAYEAEQDRLRRVAAERAARERAARERALAALRAGGSCAGGGGKEWGGYPNGFIPESALHALDRAPGHRLRCDAARAFNAMTAAYARDHGGTAICVTDSYRSYSEQQRLYAEKPSLAAVPGTSNHGWALAVDLCGGAQRAGSDADRWLHAHAPAFGWHHPSWAEPGGSRPEAWHWEFGHIS